MQVSSAIILFFQQPDFEKKLVEEKRNSRQQYDSAVVAPNKYVLNRSLMDVYRKAGVKPLGLQAMLAWVHAHDDAQETLRACLPLIASRHEIAYHGQAYYPIVWCTRENGNYKKYLGLSQIFGGWNQAQHFLGAYEEWTVTQFFMPRSQAIYFPMQQLLHWEFFLNALDKMRQLQS